MTYPRRSRVLSPPEGIATRPSKPYAAYSDIVGKRARIRYAASVLIWLVFLIEPMVGYYSEAHSFTDKVLTSLFVLGFAAAYIVAHVFPSSMQLDLRNAWPAALVMVFIALLTSEVGLGSAPGLLIFAGSVVGSRFQLRHGLPMVAALVAVGAGIVMASGEDGDLFLVLLILFAWWGVYGIRYVFRVNAELRLAQEELADLQVTAERERVARDVHDLLGHSLTVISIKSQLAVRLVEDRDDRCLDRAAEEIAEIETLTRSALADVRATIGGIRAPGVASSLSEARRALVSAGVQLVVVGNSAEVTEPAVEHLFAWTLREAITNVIRHSGAHHCRIHIAQRTLSISDDGVGLLPGARGSGGHGLRGLAERARAAGANFDVIFGATESGSGEHGEIGAELGGTTVRVGFDDTEGDNAHASSRRPADKFASEASPRGEGSVS